MNNDNLDLEKLDKVFPQLHDAGEFDLSFCIPKGLEFLDDRLSIPVVPQVARLLTKYGYATVKINHPKYMAALTDRGRDAKATGGHFKYLKTIADKDYNEKENSKYDLLQKKFIYKARYTPYIFSTLALVGTVVSICIAFKALHKSDSLFIPRKIDTRQHKLNEILRRTDTSFKVKDTLKNE